MITVTLYPPFSQVVGRKRIVCPFTPTMTVQDLLDSLAAAYPRLAEHLSANSEGIKYLTIVERHVARTSQELYDGSHVLLVAPVAGG